MIITKHGAEFTHNGKTYVIGEPIYTTDESDYRGLFGTIIEIRDGDDKETDNDTPDIYCALDEPVLPYNRKELEKRFSALYGEKKGIEDIILDFVILSPEMIVQVNTLTKSSPYINVFTITEECCSDGETNIYTYIFTDYILAKQKLNEIVAEDSRNGLVKLWEDNKDLIIESDNVSYTAWLKDNYCENHYKVILEDESFSLSTPVFKELGMSYIKEKLKNCFYEQTAQWDSVSDLSGEEYNTLCNSDKTAKKILSAIESDELLQEVFWETLSETASIIIEEHKRRFEMYLQRFDPKDLKELKEQLEKHKELTLNNEQFIIRPYKDAIEIVKEGEALNNAILFFAIERYSKGKDLLFTFRLASEPEKPYGALEFMPNGILRHAQYDSLRHITSPEELNFIERFRTEVLMPFFADEENNATTIKG